MTGNLIIFNRRELPRLKMLPWLSLTTNISGQVASIHSVAFAFLWNAQVGFEVYLRQICKALVFSAWEKVPDLWLALLT